MTRGDARRRKRREWFEALFPGRALFIAALIIMPALLFNPSTQARVLQFFFFWFLAWLSGKKNNPLITIIVIVVIVFFNLLVPYGRVIVSLGPFSVTVGALLAGIHRAVTLEALVMLSRTAIRPGLKLPGLFGEILGESFRIFGQIMERKIILNRGDIAGDLDRLLLELSGETAAPGPAPETPAPESAGPAFAPQRPLTAFSLISLIAVILLSWLPVLFILP
jgi:heptaprenyl diphosphate synthase